MLLFKYPMQKRWVEKFKAEIRQEEEGLDEEEISLFANARLLNSGITDDIENLAEIICEDYTDEEIQADIDAVDFDHAQAEVEKMEEEKRKAQLMMI